jgi:hypothetical protein
MPARAGGPGDPAAEAMPLARIVDGWLLLANAPAPVRGRPPRRAA